MAIAKSAEAARAVRNMPGPKRGEVIRQIREALNDKVGALGDLISLEMGKIKSEGKGEVQEFIDIVSNSWSLPQTDDSQERQLHRILSFLVIRSKPSCCLDSPPSGLARSSR